LKRTRIKTIGEKRIWKRKARTVKEVEEENEENRNRSNEVLRSRTDWYSGNALDLYPGVLSSVLYRDTGHLTEGFTGTCRDSTSIRPQPLASKSFSSARRPMFCSANTDSGDK
jgi:hypothetical protein